jgi:hypothetical protein
MRCRKGDDFVVLSQAPLTRGYGGSVIGSGHIGCNYALPRDRH